MRNGKEHLRAELALMPKAVLGGSGSSAVFESLGINITANQPCSVPKNSSSPGGDGLTQTDGAARCLNSRRV